MTERNGAALLSLKEVHRHYVTGGVVVRALDGIDLDVQEGEVVMLLGPSGSGKTTLLNVVSALDSPTSGTYHFDGELVPSAPEENKPKRISIPTPHPALRLLTWLPEAIVNLIMWLIFLIPHYLKHTLPRTSKLEKMTEFRRENVGYVFQFFNLLGDLTALENVMLAQEIHGGRDKERALQMLQLVGLEGMEGRFPSELSGGEQQRVAIARSLAKSPKLLLGDELTGNLDSETTAQVMKVLVRSCRKERITAIIVTHDLELTKHATRVIRMDSGKLISDKAGGRAPLNSAMGAAEGMAEAAVEVAGKAAKAVGGVIAGAVTNILDSEFSDEEEA